MGIRVPADIYADVSRKAALTADKRAEAVEARDSRVQSRSRDLLRTEFPSMPDDTLELVLKQAYLKGSGRVGRTSTETDEDKAALAVQAHIRHHYTPYDALIESGLEKKEARRAIKSTVQGIMTSWRAKESRKVESLPRKIIAAEKECLGSSPETAIEL